MSERKYTYQVDRMGAYIVSGDGSGVPPTDTTEIQVMSNAPAYADGTLTVLQPERDQGIRALFEEVLDCYLPLAVQPENVAWSREHWLGRLNALLGGRA